ncbi:hypothetical protein [Clostridium intestinale]|uniref:Uncharacterized protein n=1 Tax=Clostridium intestinale TaxID=36845 RepID=A0A7D6VZ86_9CLOT|nr:hypothetical protein [Clostridium intestinale]QLY79171.1 hypothetical protein HZF06_19130 [Clostridium intestinale]
MKTNKKGSIAPKLSKKYVPDIPKESPKLIPLSPEEIKNLQGRNNEKIIFSFNFLDIDHKLFNLGSMEKRKVGICSEWFVTLFDGLKEISNLTPNDLKSSKQHYGYHRHDWDELPAKFNFDKEFLEQIDGVQFRISSSKGRVHGFMVGNTFYVVWLDPYHNLYPDERYGGTKYYEKPETCFEKISNELARLKKDYEDLHSLLDKETS